ncbi:Hypothetical predicted protein [Mytilus galloprovincialis]|uniref:DZIP3-like HEPN domain-containing protein n=1 Tax=Mytilus galloprovincialis TaxID=29158 RepID=A0A8B6F8T5_MYTGA|nr:Hypothetical predicted protein [Mytilus galloprovincialis]
MRIVIKEHTVIESHPDSAHEDLRLDHPFPRLVEYCNSLDLESMDQKEHSHTPWIVIVYKYLQKWKESHDGNAPKNYKEKLLFKEFIKQGIRSNKEGFPLDEENFDEAVKSVNTALVPSSMPSVVRKLFEDPCCSNLDAESSSFWILVRAVKEFVDNEGKDLLPLRGTIPDMTADSTRYIQLQHVYHGQADDDVAVVTEKVRKIEQSIAKEEPVDTLNMPPPNYDNCISDHDIKLFCKNAAFLRIFRSRSLAEEYNNKTANLQEIDELLIKTEDIHYLLSVHAISNIATPAVRDVFDKEFSPHTLRKTLQMNMGTLHNLKRQKHINLEDWKLLFDNRKSSPLNSAHFDLRLMVLLLRNIASFDIVNSLPEPTNKSKDADLSRIHYYRNLIAHNHGRMSNEDLVQSVKDLMEVAKRLRSMPMNSSSVEKQLWIDQFDSPDKLTQAVKGTRKPRYVIVLLSILYPIRKCQFPSV